MFKPTILIAPLLFVAVTGPSFAGDRDVAADLPCNALCTRWMAMAKPTAAVDLHPANQPPAAPAIAAAPTEPPAKPLAPPAKAAAAGVPQTPPHAPVLPTRTPLPPRRPVVVVALRPPHEQHAMLMSRPQRLPPAQAAPAPIAVPVALALVPTPAAPQPGRAAPIEPAPPFAAGPEKIAGPAAGDRPVNKGIDFVLPPLDQLPSSQPITVPPALDVIAAVLLAGRTQP